MKEGIVSLLFQKVKKKSQIRNKNIKATKLKFVKKKELVKYTLELAKHFFHKNQENKKKKQQIQHGYKS